MKSPAFSLYVRDVLCSKTISKMHSKGVSKGVSAYLYLLCSSWLEEPRGTLPNDPVELAGMAKVSAVEWNEIWPYIESQFPVGEDGRRYNERLVQESEKQNKRRDAGSKGGSKTQAKRKAASEDENEDENKELFKLDGAYSQDCKDVLAYLNIKTGKQFRECDSSLTPIKARLKESGVSVDGIKQMIDRQCQKWKGTSMEDYLRPQTLFGKEKFESYYAAREMPLIAENGQKTEVATPPNPDKPAGPRKFMGRWDVDHSPQRSECADDNQYESFSQMWKYFFEKELKAKRNGGAK